MIDSKITTLLITLSVRLELSEAQILALTCFLPTEEQQWQMILWLRRMMGKEFENHLEFRDIWLQVEKIKEIYPEDEATPNR